MVYCPFGSSYSGWRILSPRTGADDTHLPRVNNQQQKLDNSKIRSIMCKGPKYRFPSLVDFNKCREEMAGSL